MVSGKILTGNPIYFPMFNMGLSEVSVPLNQCIESFALVNHDFARDDVMGNNDGQL